MILFLTLLSNDCDVLLTWCMNSMYVCSYPPGNDHISHLGFCRKIIDSSLCRLVSGYGTVPSRVTIYFMNFGFFFRFSQTQRMVKAVGLGRLVVRILLGSPKMMKGRKATSGPQTNSLNRLNLPETNRTSPLKIGRTPKRKCIIFQPLIFRGEVMLVSGRVVDPTKNNSQGNRSYGPPKLPPPGIRGK